jgi:hypothetical protein
MHPSKHQFQNFRPNAAIALLSKICQIQASDYQIQNKKRKCPTRLPLTASDRLLSKSSYRQYYTAVQLIQT